MKSFHIEVVSPVAEFRDVAQEAAKHAARAGILGKRALVLPAEKSSSPPFVRRLVDRVASATAARGVFTANPDWAFFHPSRALSIGPEIDRLASDCDVMIAGVAY